MFPLKKKTIGIDLGGTSVRVGLFDEDLELLGSESMVTRVVDGPLAVLDDIASAIDRLAEKAGTSRGALANEARIGIGSPGPIDLRTGTLGHLPNFPGWDYFPLRERLAQVTGLPVFLDCDANVAALAEWKLGAGREAKVDSLAMLTLGTGVGSGIILKGQLWHGMIGMGGEAGHVSLNRKGPLCGCGGRGCLETYASATGLVRLAVKAAEEQGATAELRELTSREQGFTAKDVAQLAEAGDESAAKVFTELGWWLGLGLSALTNILDLPLIIIGGGLADSWKLFAPAMFDTLKEHSIIYRLGEPSQRELMEADRTFIRPASLGAGAGLLGAALLPSLAQSNNS